MLKSTDAGASWTDITGNLPQAPVNDIVVDGSSLLVATDVGVYVTTDGGDDVAHARERACRTCRWTTSSWSRRRNELFAGTFGRGMWKVSLAGL